MAQRKCKACHKPHDGQRKMCAGCVVVQEMYRKERRKHEDAKSLRWIGRGM